ncbi:exodeoxyribonuclease V subunit gamma [Vibrio sp.]|uniref:exodeoxyribonuclease V subunit gamma n=1 Tax=Vibrio sp. TaxID=678 RepID=UPI003D0C65CE
MFTVYHSNQVDILKSLLVELIRRQPLQHPFQQEQILVQSPGMSQWLKMELARSLGVAANIAFPLPATFIWDQFSQVLPDVPKRSAFNKPAMCWKLMQLLPQLLDRAEFAPLKRYLSDDEDGSKRYQLAEKIADIFDGYLVYRPEWIASWEAGLTVAELGDEHPWQPILWQALYDHTVSLDQSPYHRANLYEQFIDTLQNSRQEFDFPKRLFVFGISSLPPRYIDALKAIGEHTDVHLMFTNPCRYYWGDVRDQKFLARLAARHRQHLVWHQDHSELEGETGQLKDDVNTTLHTDAVGNSLLASMGKLGRDNHYLLAQSQSHEIEAFVDIARDSLLHQLQADILNLEQHQDDHCIDNSQHKQRVSAQDNSVSLHACHSPMREVEVLHDQLLAMFAADPELKPRDIIVMVADINAYSPAIQAVFGNAPGERYIPYSISDRSAEQENPILAAFLQLIHLPQSRCLASELLELLETPAILRRFAISETQFSQAKRWVEESGIRWGLDEHTASQFELPASRQNTWQFGIERMLLGYAMPQSAGLLTTDQGEILPYQEIEGLGAELAGKLAQFIQTISELRSQLSHPQSVEQWRACINQLLERCFSAELDEELALKSIRDALTQLQEQLSDAAYQEELSPAVLRYYLQNSLSGSRVSQRFLAGQVNFCTLMPMRSIPFKTVCLLGMNDGAYPRTVAPEGFDLINGRSRPGDRSRRDDDRYLFLEALLSAQRNLYISYVGRSIQDNSDKAPSILVSELLEYLEQNYCLVGDEQLPVDKSGQRLLAQLTRQHAMVPFSVEQFNSADGSFAKEWLPAARRQGQASGQFSQPLTDVLLDSPASIELDLVELQRFWRLPVQYFFNRRLQVRFDRSLAVMADDEPFILDGLQSYQLRDELLNELLALPAVTPEQQDQQWQQFIRCKRAEGKLPVGALGELEFAANRVQAEAMLATLQPLCQQLQPDQELRLTTILPTQQQLQLTGWITQHYRSGLVRFRMGRLRGQDYLSAWIDHLAMAAAGQSCPTHMVGYDKKEGVVHKVYSPLASPELARQLLQPVQELYFQGLNQPLCYFPQTCLAGVEAGFNRGKWVEDPDRARQKMAEAFNDGYLRRGEGRNDYIRRIWPQWQAELASQSYQLARQILEPARRAAIDSEQYYAELG